MNMPTPQQEGFYRVLSKLCDLTVVYESDITQDRRDLGWRTVPAGYKYYFVRSLPVSKRFTFMDADFHFLAGLPGSVYNVSRVLLAGSHTPLGIQAEMRIPEVETMRRRLQSILYARVLNVHEATCFAIGKAMEPYYAKLGIPRHHIFRYAYFSSTAQKTGATFGGPVLFVGQLVQRKAVDILIHAFARSQARTSHNLMIVGDGQSRLSLQTLAKTLGIGERVQFIGAVEQHRVTSLMNEASVLVLPSHHDGWGFVVNEALSVGLPVVVSDGCGVAEVIEMCGGGNVVPAGDVERLAVSLDALLESKDTWGHHSQNALATHSTISAEAGALYFLQVVQYIRSGYSGERPVAPWLKKIESPNQHATGEGN